MPNVSLNSFTKEQQCAITHYKGPCLVLAGPGSGKTKVITHRVAHLIFSQKISPEHILTITFTKAAAKEMEERFSLIAPNINTRFGTFHSCFYYILKNSYVNYPNTFITSKDKRTILLKLVSKLKLDITEIDIEQMEQMLALYVNHNFQEDLLPQFANCDIEMIREIYSGYCSILKTRKVTDFDMLLMDAYNLLKKHPEIAEKWQNQFQYILIDECQDMNCLQYETIKLLSGCSQNVFMVGDDDQSIYRFRGANVSFMQRFLDEYKNVKVLQLDTNFRSQREIVKASQKVIQQNENRFQKHVKTFHEEKGNVCVKGFSYRKEMFQYIIERFQNASKPKTDTLAIICRTRAELRSWGHILRQNNIPYQAKEEDACIFDENWYLDIEAYLHLIMENYKIEDILRVFNKPQRGIYREDLRNDKQFVHKLFGSIFSIKNMSTFLVLKYIWESMGYRKWIEATLNTNPEKQKEVVEAFRMILEESKKYPTLDMWMEHVEKERLLFEEKRKQTNTSNVKENISLLTMHSAKGLEFDTVFLPDINKGKMPSGSLCSKETIEEERRLFYVAMTRAKKELQILYIKGTEDHKLQPSEFIEPLLSV